MSIQQMRQMDTLTQVRAQAVIQQQLPVAQIAIN